MHNLWQQYPNHLDKQPTSYENLHCHIGYMVTAHSSYQSHIMRYINLRLIYLLTYYGGTEK